MDKITVFIEVQTETYFGEDDIVRLEDDYMIKDEKRIIIVSLLLNFTYRSY